MTFAPDPVFLAFQAAVAGRYSIDRELGRGGMGIVYLAHEVHLDRLVAIKLLPPDRATDPALRERFLGEARLAAKLSHPNIIPIHTVDESGGFVYFVMAFVDGETLAERVRTRGPLGASEGSRVLREVSWALAHAHSQGLVHRDVKPDNILLEAGTGRALVADFGIAAVAGDAAAGVTGTPEFMSPEQATGAPIDARSDLYSLGATAFFAFSGRIPFDGRTATEIVARHATERAPVLASSGVAVPRRIASLVDRCLAKDPAQRPASADAVADQLGLAMEQRRELPAALRAFVKRSARMDGGGTLIFAVSLLSTALMLAPQAGGRAAFATLLGGATLGSMGFMVNAARRLLRQGFTHADVKPAFQREREQISEELAVDHRSPPPRFLERLLRALAIGGIGIGVAGTATMIGVSMSSAVTFANQRGILDLIPVLALVAGGGILSALGYLALLQRRTDVDTAFWKGVWTGPLGRVAFALARQAGGRQPAVAAVTHRATELSLGLAAEQLFEALPREARLALGDFPAVLQRLQDDARRLRSRYDSLQDALSGMTGDRPDLEDLRRARDDVHARLGESVGALETLRLGLLRLHAGATTVDGFTTHLGLAGEVSSQVERLISAQGEVDRMLAFPAAPSLTPA